VKHITVPTLAEQRACESLVTAFAQFSDDRRFEEAASVFHLDGTFYRPLQPEVCLEGRDAILDALASKAVDTLSWHICTNMRFEKFGPQEIHGVTYFSVYMHWNCISTTPPVEFSGKHYLGRYQDVFTRRPRIGWRIQSRRGLVSMVR
jgi:hypothetical protein